MCVCVVVCVAWGCCTCSYCDIHSIILLKTDRTIITDWSENNCRSCRRVGVFVERLSKINSRALTRQNKTQTSVSV